MLRARPNVPKPIARQHKSIPTRAQFRRGEESPQMPITRPNTAIMAAGGQIADRPAAKTPSTRDATVPPIAIMPARRAGMMAMGGTVASLVLGVFAAGLSAIWPPAAMIAVLGLVMGIWGLSSPRRNWALVGMLLCCLAIGLGTFGLARSIYIAIQQNRAITIDEY